MMATPETREEREGAVPVEKHCRNTERKPGRVRASERNHTYVNKSQRTPNQREW